VLQISALVSRFRHHFDGEKAVIKLWVFEDQALDVVDPRRITSVLPGEPLVVICTFT